MNAARITRLAVVTSGIALACLTARPCRAQAEIAPDHYENAPVSPPPNHAAANHGSHAVAKAVSGAPQTSELRSRRQKQSKVTAPSKPAAAHLVVRKPDARRPYQLSTVPNRQEGDIRLPEALP